MKTDIRTLDLNLLKTLDALMDERSVTRAASRLSLTQPAVSGMLNRLRDYFDDPLFIRAPHGIVPTTRAEELAAPVKRILADIDVLLQPTGFDPLSASMTFTVAATDYALRAVMVPFIAALKIRAPAIRVRVVPVESDRLVSQLERGSVDVALITPHTTPAELHSRALYDERYVCMMRADHPDAGKPLSLARFCALEHVLVSYEGDGFRGVTDSVLEKIGRMRRVGLSVSHFLVLPDVLALSDMIATVPSRIAENQTEMFVCETPVSVPGFTKSMAWHGRTHRNPAQAWLRELMLKTSQRA
ncbi:MULTISPECIES: LysR family transcriptional regulator [Leclercia]|uniref:LysR family transcriptional regulator n=1 Tax=Leclercia TaxID=83654 RepID=UPI000CD2A6A7|nr:MULTISPECIES: LysR family transcriptional regulator [Leclercia]POV33297.1 transcriptional regulator [Leclercia sp. LSNIH5]POW65388.1 transcriptional regulator [Leclercia sp. LSNIH2]AUU83422.1 transcriptional regulator [Leclercia sp. LSNIH1]QGW15044.1 LysR family transcriptional regulator [Leclercia sp. Colony189]URM23009.1 LysR family transcriptional regulator [Leclercia adecarboxylata]